jgi:glycosyltransferase involved in cell wall biosynthesis
MKMSVISIFRDIEEHIWPTLNGLESFEKNYDIEFEYFFYENDSKDNTVSILEKWLANRKGLLVSEKLFRPNFSHVQSVHRTSLLADYRNRILNKARPLDSDYTILLDSEIVFANDILDNYINRIKEKDMAMVTPAVLQPILSQMPGEENEFSYFDSYALVTNDGMLGMTFAQNPFWSEEDRKRYYDGYYVSVLSAFGGFVLIKSEILNNLEVEWSTKSGGCEHWEFCQKVGKYGKIIVDPQIEVTVSDIKEDTVSFENIKEVCKQQKKALTNKELRKPWQLFQHEQN